MIKIVLCGVIVALGITFIVYRVMRIVVINRIFDDIDNLTWYHVDKHGEVVQGSNSDYETFYKAKDIFDVLAKYGYEDYDG